VKAAPCSVVVLVQGLERLSAIKRVTQVPEQPSAREQELAVNTGQGRAPKQEEGSEASSTARSRLQDKARKRAEAKRRQALSQRMGKLPQQIAEAEKGLNSGIEQMGEVVGSDEEIATGPPRVAADLSRTTELTKTLDIEFTPFATTVLPTK